jgi:hypothetical protein
VTTLYILLEKEYYDGNVICIHLKLGLSYKNDIVLNDEDVGKVIDETDRFV